MTSQDIRGGWFGDVLPSGEWAVTVPGHPLVTHLGLIPLPPGEPWGIGYPRITRVGGFQVAGQAHSTDNLTLAHMGAWLSIPGPCVGISPVIFNQQGQLIISNGSVGVNGFRFVDPAGRIWTGDETHEPWNGLSQWTRISDDLYIGQCHASNRDEALIWDGAVLRLLEPQRSFFIRANWDGEQVAISLSLPDRVRLIWTTLSELRALPVYAPPPPQPKPPEPPVPEPEPEPEPEPPEEPPVSTPEQWQQWMNSELPHLMAIYAERHHGDVPNGHWGAFQTARRGITVPEGPWTYEAMVQHEQAQGEPTDPPEPP